MLQRGVLKLNNKKRWITWTIVIVILTNTLTFFGSKFISLSLPNGNVVVTRQNYNELLDFQKLFTVRQRLYDYYDGNIKEEDLLNGAVKGMTSALNDPYTVYWDAKEYSDFNTQMEGDYSGIGVTVSNKDGKITIVNVSQDSPAKKAGIIVNDQIVKVNGTEVSGKELDKAVSLMRGINGTNVTVTFYRKIKGTFDVVLKRAKLDVPTVTGEILNENKKIGYMQISMFGEKTAAEFEKELKALKDKGAKGFIIDLRDNGGGSLDECIDMVSNFVPKGKVIVSTIDKYKKEKKYDSKGGIAIGMPLVILVNGNTASASEIFSGAVRDYKLGTLIGTKTFGKGIVQSIIDEKLLGFGDGTALKVTVSKYYTPNGENIQGKGINPDIMVKYPEELSTKTYNRSTDPQFEKALEVISQKVVKAN